MELSAADAALRERITELSVHIPCGGVRERDLCTVCCRGTGGGTSRWSWHPSPDCRAVNDSLGTLWGVRPLALGRHSIMNGISVRRGQPSREASLSAFDRLLNGRT